MSAIGVYFDIDDVSSKIRKLADDTKNHCQYFFCKRTKYPTNRSNQVDGLSRMKFNVNKCKVMHIGYNNPSYQYLMNDKVLFDREEERHLGVTIYKSLKQSCHIAHCVKRDNQMFGMIIKSFHFKDRKNSVVVVQSVV